MFDAAIPLGSTQQLALSSEEDRVVVHMHKGKFGEV